MAYNLFIAYDLNKELDSKGYTTLFTAINALGSATRVQKSVWFVSSTHDAETARNHLKQFIDQNDFLLVIEASYAVWTKLEGQSAQFINSNWTPKTR